MTADSECRSIKIVGIVMERGDFLDLLKQVSGTVSAIREEACSLHESVGQTYGKNLPYGFHLCMVADTAMEFCHAVLEDREDVLPLVFGAYFHDSIEDARLTYNDVRKLAARYMDDRQAYMAAEIVYALTNDKGRTREERAGEKYYKGIRETPYAPFIKLCDRFANMSYSFTEGDSSNARMREVYSREWLHFKSCLVVRAADNRLSLPEDLLGRIENLLQE